MPFLRRPRRNPQASTWRRVVEALLALALLGVLAATGAPLLHEAWPLLGLFQYDLYSHTNYLYVLAVLAVVFYFVRRIVYSPFGQALTGIRENVRRMHAIGSPVHRRLVTVYAISAGIAGLAGALFTQTNAYVTLTVFDFDTSAKLIVMLILGGTGRLYGAFLGAAVYMLLEDKLSKISPTFWQFGIGLMLVLAVMFARHGLLGLADTAWRKLVKRGAP